MRWSLKPKPEETLVESLSQSIGTDPVISSLLIHRGVRSYDEAKQFFRPSLSELHDPFLMKDMNQAVSRIIKAIDNNENIIVYGDYDVDGTTSVALMASFLMTKTDQITTYIPDRYNEGYGISFEGIDYANDNDCSLIIALDCGIKAIDKVKYAKDLGIDFIICDHHRPGDLIPEAIAVLDPKRSDCKYPFKELCGCGVGFKLIQALTEAYGDDFEDIVSYLDIVATAIAADIVPVTGENRILAYFGVKLVNSNPRPGIKALLKEHKSEVSITDLVFKVAPKINAAGRMKHASYAVDLLMEKNEEVALKSSEAINEFNNDRREADKRITEEALQMIRENNDGSNFTTVVYNENWHKGVIGIVASRLIETYYRPTIVFTKSGDNFTASARSVSGFDIYNAIEACKEYIEQFGGHKYAAGLTIKPENYETFKKVFEAHVKSNIKSNLLEPEIKIDSQLELSDINEKFYRILKQFAPFGPGNLPPVFLSQSLKDTGFAKCVGEDNKHLKLNIYQGGNVKYPCIGFGLGHKLKLVEGKKAFNAVYSLDENHWNGNTSLQFKIKDIKEN